MISGEFTRKIDVDAEILMTPIRTLYASGDKNAHTFELSLYRNKEPLKIDGAGVIGYFIRADGYTVPVNGTASGSVAKVTLSESCYAVNGQFNLIIKVTLGSERKSVFWGNGYVTRSQTDTIVDTGRIIPSLEELLAQIDAMNTATAEAKKATTSANDAYQKAESAANRASKSAASADAAAQRADAAAKGWENDKSSDSAKLGGKAPEYYIQPRNLLDNSDFRNPVAQAGIAGMHGNARYALDRWYNKYDYGAFSQDAAGLHMTYKDNHCYASQRLDLSAYVGKPLTLAVKFAEGLVVGHCESFALGTTAIYDTSIEGLVVDLKDSTVDIIVTAADATRTVEWAALYEGVYTADTLPQYVSKGYAVELAECQRYYAHDGGLSSFCFGASSGQYLAQRFPGTMRCVPTVTLVGQNGIGVTLQNVYDSGFLVRNDTEYTSQFGWEANADL